MRLSDEPNRPAWLFKNTIPIWGWFLLGCVGLLFLFTLTPYSWYPQNREKLIQAQCQSNEKQIGLALMLYAQDFDDTLPPAEKWMNLTQSYLLSPRQGSKIYHCPRVTGDENAPFYAFDDRLSGKPRQKIKNVAQTTLMYDSTKNVRNAHDAGSSLPVPGRHGTRDRSSSGNNICYADGHVKWRKDDGASTP